MMGGGGGGEDGGGVGGGGKDYEIFMWQLVSLICNLQTLGVLKTHIKISSRAEEEEEEGRMRSRRRTLDNNFLSVSIVCAVKYLPELKGWVSTEREAVSHLKRVAILFEDARQKWTIGLANFKSVLAY